MFANNELWLKWNLLPSQEFGGEWGYGYQLKKKEKSHCLLHDYKKDFGFYGSECVVMGFVRHESHYPFFGVLYFHWFLWLVSLHHTQRVLNPQHCFPYIYIYIYIILAGRREEEVLFELELIASVFYVHIMAKAMIWWAGISFRT